MLLLAPETIAISAFSAADAARLSDDELITQQQDFAVARRLLDAGAAAVSAEIGRRSAPELGHTGLAQSRGARTLKRSCNTSPVAVPRMPALSSPSEPSLPTHPPG